MKTFLTSTAIAAVLALPLAATAKTPVSEISVEADLTAIENVTAAEVWTNLPTDLEQALAVKLADHIGEDGAEIMIDIDMLELANAFEAATDLADSTLSGEVIIERPGGQYDEQYDLTVNAEQAQVFLPADANVTLLSPGSQEFYTAMIDAFAENVAQRLD